MYHENAARMHRRFNHTQSEANGDYTGSESIEGDGIERNAFADGRLIETYTDSRRDNFPETVSVLPFRNREVVGV